MVRSTDRPTMTIAVDLGRKATKPTNQLIHSFALFFRVLCETIKDFVAKVGNAHDEKLDDSDDMSVKVKPV